MADSSPTDSNAAQDANASKAAKADMNTFEIAQENKINPRWKRKRELLHFWEEFMQAHNGVRLNFDYTLPITKPEEKAQKVAQTTPFLTQLITDIAIKDNDFVVPLDVAAIAKDDLTSMNGGVVAMFDHIAISFEKRNGLGVFAANGLIGDLYSERAKIDRDYVQSIALENMRTALLLVQNAKAAGWKSLNFGDTSDPAKRLALVVACAELGMDCSAEKAVDVRNLPQDTNYKEELVNTLIGALQEQREKPMLQITFDTPTPQQPEISPT